jgi:ribosomal-protein-alanine N-acetyltransferase
MIAAVLAALHQRCFTTPRPWTAAEIAGLLQDPLCFLRIEGQKTDPKGFLIGRAVAGEAELLTVAVQPEARRAGIGQRLLAEFETTSRTRHAETAFLEVAADNAAAQALYAGRGFAVTGRRKGYYHRPDGSKVDALVMALDLTRAPQV